jgi:hypothetical protein
MCTGTPHSSNRASLNQAWHLMTRTGMIELALAPGDGPASSVGAHVGALRSKSFPTRMSTPAESTSAESTPAQPIRPPPVADRATPHDTPLDATERVGRLRRSSMSATSSTSARTSTPSARTSTSTSTARSSTSTARTPTLPPAAPVAGRESTGGRIKRGRRGSEPMNYRPQVGDDAGQGLRRRSLSTSPACRLFSSLKLPRIRADTRLSPRSRDSEGRFRV